MGNEKSSGRRGFLLGALAGAGATSAIILTAGTAVVNSGGVTGSGTSTGPILYTRTKEAERYYKTLYT